MKAFRLISYVLACCLFTLTRVLACTTIYTVQSGDTLSAIAEDKLGSVFSYGVLHEANLDVIGPDPNRLRVGQKLNLPCDAAPLTTFDWSKMPKPDRLMTVLKQPGVQVLDIRSQKALKAGMLPNTIWVPYKTWRGPKANPGYPPSAERLAEIVGQAGLRLDQPIVIVSQKNTAMDTGRAAFIYWILKSAGAGQMAILRGGFKGWEKAQMPVALDIARPDPYQADVTFSRQWRADSLDVYGIATRQIPGHLLDARPHKFVNRLDKLGKALATTLPNARNAPVQTLITALEGEIDVEQGAQYVVDHLLAYEADWRDGQVISFCSSGELAALNWFYASEIAGLDNFRLYPESVKGWSSDGGKLFPVTQGG